MAEKKLPHIMGMSVEVSTAMDDNSLAIYSGNCVVVLTMTGDAAKIMRFDRDPITKKLKKHPATETSNE